MKLRNITVRNLRLFGDTEQSICPHPDKHALVLLGDNGAGKTTLLYGCSVMLSQYFEHFPNIAKKEFTFDDIRNVDNERKADYMHFGITIDTAGLPSLGNGALLSADKYLRGDGTNVPSSVLEPIKSYGGRMKSSIDDEEASALPILAYYGTERGQIKAPERRREFSTIFPRWASYDDALEPATNFKRFFTWFERNEDEERRAQIARQDFGYRSHTLEAVRRALEMLFDNYRNPRVATSPLRFVMDDVSDADAPKEIRIERMSDGYRIMTALVADIAARMAEANPTLECSGLEDPLMSAGIVLIDEIDLHLHPALQRKVLRKLTGIFPNVQFIVSTHSPNVVLGALDIIDVVRLENGIIHSGINLAQYEKYDVSLMLLSDLFDLDNVRTQEYKERNDEYEGLLAQPSLTEEERARLDTLSQQLDGFSSEEVRQFKEHLNLIAGGR